MTTTSGGFYQQKTGNCYAHPEHLGFQLSTSPGTEHLSSMHHLHPGQSAAAGQVIIITVIGGLHNLSNKITRIQ